MSVKFWGPATLRSFKRVAKVLHKILKVWICLKIHHLCKNNNFNDSRIKFVTQIWGIPYMRCTIISPPSKIGDAHLWKIIHIFIYRKFTHKLLHQYSLYCKKLRNTKIEIQPVDTEWPISWLIYKQRTEGRIVSKATARRDSGLPHRKTTFAQTAVNKGKQILKWLISWRHVSNNGLYQIWSVISHSNQYDMLYFLVYLLFLYSWQSKCTDPAK